MGAQASLALVGAGNRGRGIFGQYALDMPHRAKFVAVAEPDPARRAKFAADHKIPESMCFASADALLARGKVADGMVVATLENLRREVVLGAIAKGYNVLVEKPLGCSPEEVVEITDAAKACDKIFIVCHQMRHMPAYSTIKEMLDSGRYGRVHSIQHSENLSWHHMAHSFVRGFFNNDALTPMLLAKSCHDMDILRYLVGRRATRVSSFGSLTHFKAEHAPAGAPARCLDGCPAAVRCPYDVLKIYFNDDTDPAYLRQMGVVKDKTELLELLKTNCFGRCVYHCDNNVVDHQEVLLEFEGGVTASFEMCGPNFHERRMTKFSMTNGEIQYDSSEGVIKAYTFEPLREEVVKPCGMAGTHGGGDRIIMDSFLDAIAANDPGKVLTPVGMSLDSHLMVFAAERARLEGRVVDMAEFEAEVRRGLAAGK